MAQAEDSGMEPHEEQWEAGQGVHSGGGQANHGRVGEWVEEVVEEEDEEELDVVPPHDTPHQIVVRLALGPGQPEVEAVVRRGIYQFKGGLLSLWPTLSN